MSLTIKEVAEAVRVSPDTVKAAIDRGDLKCWRPGPRIIRIEPEAVEAWKRGTADNQERKVVSLRSLEGGR